MPESSSTSIRPILALTADMIFASRVKSTADAVGTPLQLVRNADQMLRLAAELNPRLIVIDLDVRTLDPVDLIRRLKAGAQPGTPRILAYVSHVREDLINDAREAGADQVMARGAFSKNLPAILAPA
jgi:CheY-like chemotaxis protein